MAEQDNPPKTSEAPLHSSAVPPLSSGEAPRDDDDDDDDCTLQPLERNAGSVSDTMLPRPLVGSGVLTSASPDTSTSVSTLTTSAPLPLHCPPPTKKKIRRRSVLPDDVVSSDDSPEESSDEDDCGIGLAVSDMMFNAEAAEPVMPSPEIPKLQLKSRREKRTASVPRPPRPPGPLGRSGGGLASKPKPVPRAGLRGKGHRKRKGLGSSNPPSPLASSMSSLDSKRASEETWRTAYSGVSPRSDLLPAAPMPLSRTASSDSVLAAMTFRSEDLPPRLTSLPGATKSLSWHGNEGRAFVDPPRLTKSVPVVPLPPIPLLHIPRGAVAFPLSEEEDEEEEDAGVWQEGVAGMFGDKSGSGSGASHPTSGWQSPASEDALPGAPVSGHPSSSRRSNVSTKYSEPPTARSSAMPASGREGQHIALKVPQPGTRARMAGACGLLSCMLMIGFLVAITLALVSTKATCQIVSTSFTNLTCTSCDVCSVCVLVEKRRACVNNPWFPGKGADSDVDTCFYYNQILRQDVECYWNGSGVSFQPPRVHAYLVGVVATLVVGCACSGLACWLELRIHKNGHSGPDG